MKIVQFEDGNYALRTYWLFGWHFKSLTANYNWKGRQQVINYCLTPDYEKIKKLSQQKRMKYKIIENEQ